MIVKPAARAGFAAFFLSVYKNFRSHLIALVIILLGSTAVWLPGPIR